MYWFWIVFFILLCFTLHRCLYQFSCFCNLLWVSYSRWGWGLGIPGRVRHIFREQFIVLTGTNTIDLFISRNKLGIGWWLGTQRCQAICNIRMWRTKSHNMITMIHTIRRLIPLFYLELHLFYCYTSPISVPPARALAVLIQNTFEYKDNKHLYFLIFCSDWFCDQRVVLLSTKWSKSVLNLKHMHSYYCGL